jgi:hypothetical protein
MSTGLASFLSNEEFPGRSLYSSPIALSIIFFLICVSARSNSLIYPFKMVTSWVVIVNPLVRGFIAGPEGISGSPDDESEL